MADPDDSQRLRSGRDCGICPRENPDIEIIARAHYDDEVAYITERGANQVVMGEREIARTMLELLETPPAGEVVTGVNGGCRIIGADM